MYQFISEKRQEECTLACDSDCFPAAAMVNLENGKSVMMAELQVGDKVQTGMT